VKVLFEVVNGEAGVRVSQDGDAHLVLETVIEGQLHRSRLDAEQAVALATSILRENAGMTMRFAEQLDDETCALLGQAFLYPAAKRSLARAGIPAQIPREVN
jgi:hypothetical protein